MRKLLAGVGGLAAASLALSMASLQMPADATASSPGSLASTSKIDHVVIIYQENHTFDDVLGGVCEARSTPCNGFTGPITMADGTHADNVVQPDIIPVIQHDPDSQQRGIDNEWNTLPGCDYTPYWCVSHVDPTDIPNLASLADTYAVSDATFAAGHAATFVAHVSLGAGTFDGFAGYNPVYSKTGVKPRWGWGCPSRLDDLWGPLNHLTLQPTCVPDQQGQGPYRTSKVPYTPTIFERMEQAGKSWHIYEGLTTGTKPDATNFSVCSYFYWCYANRFKRKWDSGDDEFVAAAAAGKLPNLSVLIPDGGVSQHNLTSMHKGDNYIGDMVSAVMNGPDWDSTAIFITYDDCGCFYDHVTPPDKSLGLRNPMVIVSPWTKPVYTDSTVAVQPYSMLAFVQDNFGLSPLSADVDAAYNYANTFDFSQQPLRGLTMTHQTIPRSEERELAKLLPLVENDPA